MSKGFPILEYARSGSSIDNIPGAKRIQLARPPAWPKFVFDSIALPILAVATLILLLIGVAALVPHGSPVGAASGVMLLFISALPAAVAWQLVMELASLRRAGKRPIVLVLHDQTLFIDDAALRCDGCVELKREAIMSLELTPRPLASARQKNWTLRIKLLDSALDIEFVEDDNERDWRAEGNQVSARNHPFRELTQASPELAMPL